jgi:hypothetical protein
MNPNNEPSGSDLRLLEELREAGCLRRYARCYMLTSGALLLAVALMLVLCALFAGCTTVRYLPGEETVRRDSTYIYKVERDSIHVRDSIYTERSGDTLYRYQLRYVFIDRRRTDTLWRERIDTTRVPYPVEVERPLSLSQQLRLRLFDYVLAAAALAAFLAWQKRKQ